MWFYGKNYEFGFDISTIITSIGDDTTSFDSSTGSRLLSPDSQAAAIPLGPIRRLTQVADRWETVLGDNEEQEDAFPEYAFDNDESDTVSVSDSDDGSDAGSRSL